MKGKRRGYACRRKVSEKLLITSAVIAGASTVACLCEPIGVHARRRLRARGRGTWLTICTGWRRVDGRRSWWCAWHHGRPARIWRRRSTVISSRAQSGADIRIRRGGRVSISHWCAVSACKTRTHHRATAVRSPATGHSGARGAAATNVGRLGASSHTCLRSVLRLEGIAQRGNVG